MPARGDHRGGGYDITIIGSPVYRSRSKQMNQSRPPINGKITYKWTQPYHHVSGWRKRQTLDRILDDLHTTQLDMIDEAVEKSDLRDAKELIQWIMEK